MAILVLVGVAALATPVLATSYTVKVSTPQPSYSGTQKISVNGTVTPAPGNSNTAVIVSIYPPTAPNGATPSTEIVDVQDDSVNAQTGVWSETLAAGGTSEWIAGTYLVNATWGGNNSTAVGTTTFVYSPNATSSTTSSTTTTSTTSTTTTSSTKTTSTTTTSSSSSSVASVSVSTSIEVITETVGTTTSSTTSTSTSHGASAGSYLDYVIVVVVLIVIVAGFMLWRRKVASDYTSSTAPAQSATLRAAPSS